LYLLRRRAWNLVRVGVETGRRLQSSPELDARLASALLGQVKAAAYYASYEVIHDDDIKTAAFVRPVIEDPATNPFVRVEPEDPRTVRFSRPYERIDLEIELEPGAERKPPTYVPQDMPTLPRVAIRWQPPSRQATLSTRPSATPLVVAIALFVVAFAVGIIVPFFAM
jgi:hypothetical protein